MKQTTTTNYKRQFSFLDADRKKVSIEVEITERNGYPEFSMSGDYAGSFGQITDNIKPSNEDQKKLVELWNTWHLNGMNAGTDRQQVITKGLSYDDACKKLITTNKQGEPMDSDHAAIMLQIWNELEAQNIEGSEAIIKAAGMSHKDQIDFFYFNLVARYGGNELILLARNKKESLKDKAIKYFFASESLLFDLHPETNEPYRYGTGWITKTLPEDFEEQIDSLIDAIEEKEEERKGEPLTYMEDSELIQLIEDNTSFYGYEAKLCAALVKMFDLSQDDFSDIEIDGAKVCVQGTDYLAGDDEIMNEELKSSIKDSVWAFTPSFLAEFTEIDEDVFKILSERCESSNDAILSLIEKTGDFDDFVAQAESADGRAHFLNHYDGSEETQDIDGTTFYAYRN